MTNEAFEAVRLHDEGASLEAMFVPAAGMLCCSLRHHGEELLAQNAGVGAYAEQGKTMGIPLLYPWANRLADFDYSVEGRTVQVPRDATRVALDDNGLPIHGVIGGHLGWELTKAPGPDGQSLAARLSWSKLEHELFEVFPFQHDLLYEASLIGGRLEIQVSVQASGEDVVPVAFGFHPYLSLPGVPRERWRVQLPPMRHLALDAHQIPVSPEQRQQDEHFELAEQQFDDGFDVVTDPACFEVADGDRRVVLEFMEGYPCAQVFAPRPGEFICFEPMTAPTNALRSGAGLRVLSPGEEHRARFAIRVEDLGSLG